MNGKTHLHSTIPPHYHIYRSKYYDFKTNGNLNFHNNSKRNNYISFRKSYLIITKIRYNFNTQKKCGAKNNFKYNLLTNSLTITTYY